MSPVQIDAWVFATIGTFVMLLLAIIAVFLRRLLAHIDKMTDQISELGKTLQRIDRDLSGEVSVLVERDKATQHRLSELDPVWDRMRSVETRVTTMEASCEAFRCRQP